MTRLTETLAAAAMTLAFAVALFGMVNMAVTSAQAVAGAYVAPVTGAAMLDADHL